MVIKLYERIFTFDSGTKVLSSLGNLVVVKYPQVSLEDTFCEFFFLYVKLK